MRGVRKNQQNETQIIVNELPGIYRDLGLHPAIGCFKILDSGCDPLAAIAFINGCPRNGCGSTVLKFIDGILDSAYSTSFQFSVMGCGNQPDGLAARELCLNYPARF